MNQEFIVVSLRKTYLPNAYMQHGKKKHHIYTVTFLFYSLQVYCLVWSSW